MLKRLFFTLIFLITFSITNLVYAQEATVGKILKMRCLNAKTINTNNMAFKHNTPLSGSGFEPNLPVQIWRRVEEGFQCAVDMNGTSTCGNDAPTAPDPRDFKVLNLTKDQINTDSKGQVDIDVVHSKTSKEQDHYFYGVQAIETDPTNVEAEPIDPSSVALKLATFSIKTTEEIDLESNNCVTIFFDPYGSVFDSISLEPVPNVKVSLLDNSKSPVPVQPGVHQNPSTTAADGIFSFIVADGTYYLAPEKSGFIFPLALTDISNLRTKQTIYTDLYAGEPIVQQGEIQHRDIPMQPADLNNPTNTQPVITELSITPLITAEGSFQKVYGLVSHPRSMIRVYSGVRLILEQAAENNRRFELLVDNTLLDQNADLDIQAEKISLLTLNNPESNFLAWLFKPVFAQDNKLSAIKSVLPIPFYIVGVIYDNQGQVVTEGTVQIIIPEMNNQVYSIAKINKNGTVYIPSSQIPPSPYSLRVLDLKKNVLAITTTKEFITKNKAFLEQAKINLYDSESASKAATIAVQKTSIPKNLNLIKPNDMTEQAKQALRQQTKQSLNYILLTLLVIVTLGLLLFFIYRAKSKTTPQDWQKPL